MKKLIYFIFPLLLIACDNKPTNTNTSENDKKDIVFETKKKLGILSQKDKENELIDFACHKSQGVPFTYYDNKFCLDPNDNSWLAQQQRKMLVEVSSQFGETLPSSLNVITVDIGKFVQIEGRAVWETAENYQQSIARIYDKTTHKETSLYDLLDKNEINNLQSQIRIEFENYLIKSEKSGWWGVPENAEERKKWLDERIPIAIKHGKINQENGVFMLNFCTSEGANHHTMYTCIDIPANGYIKLD